MFFRLALVVFSTFQIFAQLQWTNSSDCTSSSPTNPVASLTYQANFVVASVCNANVTATDQDTG